jgi:hypothetical protein
VKEGPLGSVWVDGRHPNVRAANRRTTLSSKTGGAGEGVLVQDIGSARLKT